MTDDDLTPFADEPVFQALTGPGTPAELAGEAELLAAYRSAVPKRPRRRLAARLGAAGSVFVAAAALSGGVAAASYTNSLPKTVQNFAHALGGWAGVPKSQPVRHKTNAAPSEKPTVTPAVPDTGGDTPNLVVSPGPAGSPSATVSPTPHRDAVPGGRVHSPSPSMSPRAPSQSPTASPTPTPSETPATTPPVPAALAVAVSATRVPANDEVTISGELTAADGGVVADHVVAAFERPVGGGERTKLGSAATDANGDVSFDVPALTHNVRLVLRAGDGVHSTPVTVIEIPTVSVVVVDNGTVDSIDFSSVGATPGDTVLLLRRQQGHWLAAGQAQLDGSGAASFAVPAATEHPVRYRLVLQRTPEHARSAVGCAVVPS